MHDMYRINSLTHETTRSKFVNTRDIIVTPPYIYLPLRHTGFVFDVPLKRVV